MPQGSEVTKVNIFSSFTTGEEQRQAILDAAYLLSGDTRSQQPKSRREDFHLLKFEGTGRLYDGRTGKFGHTGPGFRFVIYDCRLRSIPYMTYLRSNDREASEELVQDLKRSVRKDMKTYIKKACRKPLEKEKKKIRKQDEGRNNPNSGDESVSDEGLESGEESEEEIEEESESD